MILLAALLVAAAAVLVLFGAILGDLGWIYGSITVTVSALLLLAAGVMRELRRASWADEHDPGADPDASDTDAGTPPG